MVLLTTPKEYILLIEIIQTTLYVHINPTVFLQTIHSSLAILHALYGSH